MEVGIVCFTTAMILCHLHGRRGHETRHNESSSSRNSRARPEGNPADAGKVVSTSMCLVTFGDVLSVYCRITQAQAAACEHVTIVYIRHGACRTEQNCGCKQCGNSVQRDSKTKFPVVAISRELCKVVCTRKPIVLQHSLQNLN